MTSKPECLLGVDLGTGGCKLTLVDTLGSIIGSSFTEYKTYYPRHGWSEQNPEDWYQTFLSYFAIYGKIHDALAPVEKQIYDAFVTGE